MRIKHLFFQFISLVIIGALVGAIFNGFNVLFCPNFYIETVLFNDYENIYIESTLGGIAIGIIQGILFFSYLLVFQMVFSIEIDIPIINKNVFKNLILLSFSTGIIVLLFAFLMPKYYCAPNFHIPYDSSEKLKFAWVQGSRKGIIIGWVWNAIVLFKKRKS